MPMPLARRQPSGLAGLSTAPSLSSDVYMVQPAQDEHWRSPPTLPQGTFGPTSSWRACLQEENVPSGECLLLSVAGAPTECLLLRSPPQRASLGRCNLSGLVSVPPRSSSTPAFGGRRSVSKQSSGAGSSSGLPASSGQNSPIRTVLGSHPEACISPQAISRSSSQRECVLVNAPPSSPHSSMEGDPFYMRDSSVSSLPNHPKAEPQQPPSPAALRGGGICPCASWLLDWEARTERLLRHHEEATRQLVESLRKDLFRKQSPRHHSLPKSPKSCRSNKSNTSVGTPVDPFCARRTEVSAQTAAFEQKVQALAKCNTKQSHRSLDSRRDASPERYPVEFMPSLTPPPGVLAIGSQPERSSSRKLRTPTKPTCLVRTWIFSLVHSDFFTMVTSLMIGLYTIAVGIMADTEMRSAVASRDVPDWLWYVDFCFTVTFAVEVLLRILSDGECYVMGAERHWNIFDVIVAVVGIMDLTVNVELNLGFLRILRACRALRVLRVLRTFPVLKDLRLMAESICACVPSLAWAITLLGSVQYIFAVVLLRGASEKVRDGSMTPSSVKVLREKFGNLSETLFSLTEAISGGRSWGEYAEPFIEVNPVYGACFPLFVVFVIFGAVNILTSIFVESTSCIANYDKELAVEEEMSKARSAITQIRDFFEELDVDGSGTLSLDELENSLSDQRVKAYFSVLQIDVSDSRSLFQLLDKDQSGDVSIEEFIEKCLRLRGAAKAMDVAAMRRENRTTRQQLKSLMKTVEDVNQRLYGKDAHSKDARSMTSSRGLAQFAGSPRSNA